MDCRTCRERYISQAAHDTDMARMERANHRLFWALVVAIITSAVLNLLWLRAWMAYDYESAVCTVDGSNGGAARYVGDYAQYYEGDYYGQDNSQEEKADP